MRVYGEAWLIINGWMDYLCLLLTAGLAGRRFPLLRGALGAAAGALYALAAGLGGPVLRGLPALGAAALLMAVIAFGKAGPRLWPLVLTAGMFLSGLADFLLRERVGALPGLLLCGLMALGLCAMAKRGRMIRRRTYRLRLTLQHRTVRLPALRDSGNLLVDRPTGLPVIVAPEKPLRPLMPKGVKAGDLATLPPGWRLARVRTAAGEACLMCFRPDEAALIHGRRAYPLRAAVAVSAFSSPRALLPEAIFSQEDQDHASL